MGIMWRLTNAHIEGFVKYFCMGQRAWGMAPSCASAYYELQAGIPFHPPIDFYYLVNYNSNSIRAE